MRRTQTIISKERKTKEFLPDYSFPFKLFSYFFSLSLYFSLHPALCRFVCSCSFYPFPFFSWSSMFVVGDHSFLSLYFFVFFFCSFNSSLSLLTDPVCLASLPPHRHFLMQPMRLPLCMPSLLFYSSSSTLSCFVLICKFKEQARERMDTRMRWKVIREF